MSGVRHMSSQTPTLQSLIISQIIIDVYMSVSVSMLYPVFVFHSEPLCLDSPASQAMTRALRMLYSSGAVSVCEFMLHSPFVLLH